MKAIQIERFGNPAEVVSAVDIAEPGPPGEKEVVIELEASPINPYDLRNDRWRLRLSAVAARHHGFGRSRTRDCGGQAG